MYRVLNGLRGVDGDQDHQGGMDVENSAVEDDSLSHGSAAGESPHKVRNGNFCSHLSMERKRPPPQMETHLILMYCPFIPLSKMGHGCCRDKLLLPFCPSCTGHLLPQSSNSTESSLSSFQMRFALLFLPLFRGPLAGCHTLFLAHTPTAACFGSLHSGKSQSCIQVTVVLLWARARAESH